MATLAEPSTELGILQEAADALREADELARAVRASDARLRALCRRWGDVAGIWGAAPYHLARACRARGLLEE